MDLAAQLPLYPDPDEHQAYVAAVDLPFPLDGYGFRIVCPAAECQFMRWGYFAEFHQAWRHALAHRRTMLRDWYEQPTPQG